MLKITPVKVAAACLVVAAGSVTTAGAAEAAPPKAASPNASCGATLNPSTTYSSAHWTVSCRDGKVTIAGYVQHHVGACRPCAAVKATFEGQINEQSADSCGAAGGGLSGPIINFSWTHPGSIADAYLFDR
jgi:hypothetical protein